MADTNTVKTASASIIAGHGILLGLIATVTAPSSNATLTCYDSLTASGTVLFQIELYSESDPFVIFFGDRFAPRFSTGLYLALDSNLAVNVWACER